MTTDKPGTVLYRSEGRGAGPAPYAVYRPLQRAKVARLGLRWVTVSALPTALNRDG